MQGVIRRWYLVLACVVIAIAGVALVGFLQPKRWESTTTIRLEPFPVSGLYDRAGSDLPAPAAMDAELDVARRPFFAAVIGQGLRYPVEFEYRGDPDRGLVFVTAAADSAERAWWGAAAAANGFLEWGREQAVTARINRVTQEIDAIDQAPPSATSASERAELVAQRQRLEAAHSQIELEAGTLVDLPPPPEDPVSPNLALRIVLAAAFGLVVGVALAVWVDRREGAPTGEPNPVPATGRGSLATGALGALAIALPLVLAAPVIAAIVSVWQLRPTTAINDEINFGCLREWLREVPDGTRVALDQDSPKFFRDHLHEFIVPRLEPADDERPVEVLLSIRGGDGPRRCGDYHLEMERR